jgi:hypothetical protein
MAHWNGMGAAFAWGNGQMVWPLNQTKPQEIAPCGL